jgi:hypothetical protein
MNRPYFGVRRLAAALLCAGSASVLHCKAEAELRRTKAEAQLPQSKTKIQNSSIFLNAALLSSESMSGSWPAVPPNAG